MAAQRGLRQRIRARHLAPDLGLQRGDGGGRPLDGRAQPLERRAGQVDERDLVGERVVLRVRGEPGRGEQGERVPVAPVRTARSGHRHQVVVDVVHHALGVAYVVDAGDGGAEPRLDEQPYRQRQGRHEGELAERVGLMVGAPAAHEQPLVGGAQGGRVVRLVEQPVAAAAQQPGERLLE
ncbi:hypothetical protein ACFQX7_36785 [Luedemannella flava]